MLVAARCGDTSTLRACINAGVSVNATDLTLDTALHWAALAGELKAARLLIAEGADVNARTERGRTPLHNAVVASQERLVCAGARGPRARAGRGGSLTWRRRRQVLELLKAGARTDVADLSGFSALDVSVHIETHSYSWRNSANRSQLRGRDVSS